MDKTAPDVGEFLFYVVEDAVHNMVADVGSRAVGENGRVTGVFDGLHHSFYGKIRKIGGGAVGKNRLVDGLVSLVIRDPGVGDIDGHPLRGYAEPAARLSDADNKIRLQLFHFLVDFLDGFAHHGWDLHFYDLGACDGVLHCLYRLPGGIDRLPSEGVESGH